jgi:hypothetical protein
MARWVWVLFALSACIAPRIDKPDPPDTAELRADYALPTVDLEPAAMEAVVTDVEEQVQMTGTICGWESVADLRCESRDGCNALFTCAAIERVRALADRIRELVLEGANGDDTVETEEGTFANPFKAVSGFAHVHQICPGLGSTPTLDEGNGTLSMNAGFTNRTLDPVIWAELDACQFRVVNAPFANVTAGGDVVLVLAEEPVGVDTDVTFLTAFELDITTELGTGTAQASFLYDPSVPRMLIAVPIGSEGTLFLYSQPGEVGLVTPSGEYRCDFAARVCSSADREVRW